MRNIILDTDIGSDIDDAFALNLLLHSPELNVLGVTTVYRNAPARARLCRRLLREWGREDIPVYAGLDRPFLQDPERIEPEFVRQSYADGRYLPPQYDESMAGEQLPAESGVDFLLRTAEACGGELELLTIGALTNVAAALVLRPALAGQIKSLTLMGGCHGRSLAEWNILCDPEAAEIVLRSGVPIRMVGLDVALACEMPQPDYERLIGEAREKRSLFARLVERWAAYYAFALPILYDPLALASLLDERVVTFAEKKLKVCLAGELRGMTYESAGGSPVQAGTAVDAARFFTLFWERFRL